MSTPSEVPEPSDPPTPSRPGALPPPAESVSRPDARENLVLAIMLKGSGCVLVLLGLLAVLLFGAPGSAGTGRGVPGRHVSED